MSNITSEENHTHHEEREERSAYIRWVAVVIAVATPCITFYSNFVRQSEDIRQLSRSDKLQDAEIRDLRTRVRTTEQDIAVIKQGTMIIKEDVRQILHELREITRRK